MATRLVQNGAVERRTSFAELRVGDSQGDEMALVGYAAQFNTLSSDLGGYREQIAPGAFRRSLASADSDVKCLAQHDPSQILGRQKNGTLTCSEDSRGLKFRCSLNPKSQFHRDIYEAVKSGLLDACSFAFTVGEDGESWDDAEENGVRFARRTLRNVALLDCSVVTFPAYPQGTAVNARSLSVPQYGYKEFFAYAKKRARQLGVIIRGDHAQQVNLDAIDKLNLEEARRIGKQIESDFSAVERQQQADDELQRRMEIAAGRLRK
jgi:uncharacterized protein